MCACDSVVSVTGLGALNVTKLLRVGYKIRDTHTHTTHSHTHTFTHARAHHSRAHHSLHRTRTRETPTHTPRAHGHGPRTRRTTHTYSVAQCPAMPPPSRRSVCLKKNFPEAMLGLHLPHLRCLSLTSAPIASSASLLMHHASRIEGAYPPPSVSLVSYVVSGLCVRRSCCVFV